MKIKQLCAFLSALILTASLSGCGGSDSKDKDSSKSESAVLSSEESSGTDNTDTDSSSEDEWDIKRISELEDWCRKDDEHKGVYVANGLETGVNLYVPSEIRVYNEKVYDGKQSCCPEKLPTPEEPFIMTDMDMKSNFIFYVADDDNSVSDFCNTTKEDVAALYEQASATVISDMEILSFDLGRINSYPAIKIVSSGDVNGEKYTQTQLIVYAYLPVRSGNESRCAVYTFTYTDYSGTLSDKIDDSISSLDFVNAVEVINKLNFDSSAEKDVDVPAVTAAPTESIADIPKITFKRRKLDPDDFRIQKDKWRTSINNE